jgi:hypothetical protein
LPNSALTRWLKQGLARGECPLCRVAHKAEHEYLWYFFDEYSTQDEALEEVRAARGFCARHAGGLRRIEVDNLRSTLGLSQTYEDTLTGLLADLDALRPGDPLTRARCPACAYRDEDVDRHTRHFVALLGEDERSRERFEASPGLCVAHFEAAWRAAGGSTATLLRDVQRRAAHDLRDQLTEHIRKQGAEAQAERPGADADAWERALWLTAGWPDGELDGE